MTYYQKVLEVTQIKHPKKIDRAISYGTAGFRRKADDLDHVIYRMGLLAVLRSKCKQATIGVMITASHNPEEDNGVKLVDPEGEMLEREWESHATMLANVSDADLVSTLESIAVSAGIDMTVKANVVFARDTRPSSPDLARALQDGIEALCADFVDYGLLTTPQLHYMVVCINTSNMYGTPSEAGFFAKLSTAFKTLRGTDNSKGNYVPKVTVDGANGVGAIKMRELCQYLGESLIVDICNDGSSGRLNYQIAGFLQKLVSQSALSLNLGLIQTAYANGSSTKYITQQLKVPVSCVATGVKHLHHAAQSYDVGVYFEANGHGTVLLSETAMQKIKSAKSDSSLSENQRESAACLDNIVDLINQTVGDAISDLLLVETILHAQGWSVDDWYKQYTDLPNKQLKVKVKDRTIIQTTNAEREATSPPGLQQAIDDIVCRYPSGRSFVRPSGTEDVVRVYSEALTQVAADTLAHEVSLKVHELAGGVGDLPKTLS